MNVFLTYQDWDGDQVVDRVTYLFPFENEELARKFQHDLTDAHPVIRTETTL